MIPSITAFVEALHHVEERFATLGTLRPVCRDGVPMVRRTALFVEAEVLKDGEHYLLFAPLTRSAVAGAERIISQLEHVESDYLCRSRIYYGELLLLDDMGRGSHYDVILQHLPAGEFLDLHKLPCDAEQLCTMVQALEQEFQRLRFSHNNLQPQNIIVGEDGRLHPVRYHYATLGHECYDDFETLLCQLKSATMPSMVVSDVVQGYDALPYDIVLPPCEGFARVCSGERFGFVDEHMQLVIPMRYLWADDFYEGRAVVEDEHGMGVLDSRGNAVIPVEYDEVRYEYATSEFIVRKALEVKVFDYNGHLKRF